MHGASPPRSWLPIPDVRRLEMYAEGEKDTKDCEQEDVRRR